MATRRISEKLLSLALSDAITVISGRSVHSLVKGSSVVSPSLRPQTGGRMLSKTANLLFQSSIPSRYLGTIKAIGTKFSTGTDTKFAATLVSHNCTRRPGNMLQASLASGTGTRVTSQPGHRFISDGTGLALPRKQRKWWRYCGAVFLAFAAGTVGFIQIRKLYLQRRGVSVFTFPHMPMQYVAPFGTYKGIVISTSMLNSIEQVEKFPVREDDVFVVSFPRSGTTWTQELVYLVSNNADVDKANSMNLEARFPYLEDHDNTMEGLHTAESPRFIKSHLPYRMLPKDISTKKPKIIYVMRNPKDMVVSFYHLWRKLKGGYRGQFPDFCELFLQDEMMFSPWTEHVKEFWERRDDDNVLFLKYEDLKMNLPQEIEKISKFLNKPLSPKQIAIIADHCSFESMKTNDKVNYKWWDDRGLTANIGTSFIRKGRVGDWKNFFTPELDARMREKVERPLAKMGIDVKYEAD